jgi:hypothetical protein
MSVERTLALALFIASALLVYWFGPRAIQSWRIYAGTGRRRQEDATGRAPRTPPGVADRLSLLAEAGYHHIGETRLVLPVGERFGWIVAADDAESYAILVGALSGPSLTGIYSAWSDGTWLGTQHPLGTATDRRGLQVRIVQTTLAEAVSVHRAGLERLRQVHGSPRPIRTMADMLALDLDYRQRFGGSRLLPLTMRIVLPALLAFCAMVLSLILAIDAPQ